MFLLCQWASLAGPNNNKKILKGAREKPQIDVRGHREQRKRICNFHNIKSSAPRALRTLTASPLLSPLKIIPPSPIVIARIIILPSKLGAPSKEKKLPIPGNPCLRPALGRFSVIYNLGVQYWLFDSRPCLRSNFPFSCFRKKKRWAYSVGSSSEEISFCCGLPIDWLLSMGYQLKSVHENRITFFCHT